MSSLEWHENQLLGGATVFSAFTSRGRYDITQMRPDRRGVRFHVVRMDHPLMPRFDGYCSTLEESKRACETNYIALQRADRWLDYMRDNDPPTEGTT